MNDLTDLVRHASRSCRNSITGKVKPETSRGFGVVFAGQSMFSKGSQNRNQGRSYVNLGAESVTFPADAGVCLGRATLKCGTVSGKNKGKVYFGGIGTDSVIPRRGGVS